MIVLPIQITYANPKYASLAIDAKSGTVVHQRHAGKIRHPASLTKMMTAYLTFQALEHDRLKPNQRIWVSKYAASKPASKLGLKKGQTIKVREALRAIIVKSANDASVVLAEAISKSEWKFAKKMTKTAKQLGMKNTYFKNASGLHHPMQKTTAYDMARLAIALKRDYPEYYHLFKLKEFKYNGRTYKSHNRVTKNYRGADGLKTGYINASGYNLVTTANKNGDAVVAVVLGGKTSKRRDKHMVKILDRAFYKMSRHAYRQSKYYHANLPKPILKKCVDCHFASSGSIPRPILKNKYSNFASSPRPYIKPSSDFSMSLY